MSGFRPGIFTLNLRQIAMVLALICAPLISWEAIREFDKIALFGFFLLPFILRIDKKQKGSYRYVILSALFALLFMVFGQKYWAFACGLSLVFSSIEMSYGRLNAMAFYSLLFYLPITRSFFTLFGFYIRLEITKWAAKLIMLFDPIVNFDGTQIFQDGQQFSVDAGCMGLRLVITGFLLTLLILNQTSLAYKVRLKPRVVSLFLLLSFILVVFANFFRIVLLIVFKSAEGTVSHELWGIAALLLFHVVPMFVLIRYTLRKDWVIQPLVYDIKPGSRSLANASMLGVSLFMTVSMFFGEQPLDRMKLNYAFDGYTAETNIDGVVTYKRGNSMFTIKPMHPLSFSNHHPMICWRGEGYEISNEAQGIIGEKVCMKARLKSKVNSDLNTVWWYANTTGFATISELEWRFRALLQGESFYILNFTSEDQDELVYTINAIGKQFEEQRI